MFQKIKFVRIEKGMTQEDLAKTSGVSRTIISGLESGTINNTTIDTLRKIADALSLTMDELFFAERV